MQSKDNRGSISCHSRLDAGSYVPTFREAECLDLVSFHAKVSHSRAPSRAGSSPGDTRLKTPAAASDAPFSPWAGGRASRQMAVDPVPKKRRGGEEKEREREKDREKEKERKQRSSRKERSRSRGREEGSSSSDEGDRRRRKRTGFDVPPAEGAPNALAPSVPVNQQATRHARRVYVGGLPPSSTESGVGKFFAHAMAAVGGNAAGPGDSVVNVYINHEKKFAFVEFRTVEECSNAMALDGIIMEGTQLRIRRPNDYNPAIAAQLGPAYPSESLNLAAIGLAPVQPPGSHQPQQEQHQQPPPPPPPPAHGDAGSNPPQPQPEAAARAAAAVAEKYAPQQQQQQPRYANQQAQGPDRIFIGGLPYHLDETQVRDLMESFGKLKALDLIRDRETGTSKGYAFCVYEDASVTDAACTGLNGLRFGERVLTVRRADQGGKQKQPQQNPEQMQTVLQQAAQKADPEARSALNTEQQPTSVVVLTNCVDADELQDESEFEDIKADMEDECSKHGKVQCVHIPQPATQSGEQQQQVVGLGKVFVQYEDVASALRARAALHGREFAGKSVNVSFLDERKFASGQLEEG